MSQELITANQANQQAAPFMGGRGQMPSTTINAGAVAIEQERAIAEARGQIQVAQMFPRDVAAARAELMDECDVFEFAQVAFYAVPRAGGTVTGPSIRLAEAVASAYGHMEWGHRELSRGDGKSEVEVYAWDKQKNNRRIRQITVDHFRDTRNGPQRLRDSKDIDDKIANVASKQMRGAILALVPKSFVEAAQARCRATLSGGNGVPLKQRIEKMTDAFSKIGVSADVLKKHLKKSLSEINADDITDLTAIFNAIKAGDRIADHFDSGAEAEEKASEAAESLANTAKTGAAQGVKGSASAEKPKGNSGQGKGNNVKATPAAEAVSTTPQAADPEPEQAQIETETQPDTAADQAPGGDESDVF